ncbi:MAG: hypothetical protein R3321_09545 [Nitrososphaeraceae archaeon]|nr:hypothetical protein [Nitrososphaeraceae archaeon]
MDVKLEFNGQYKVTMSIGISNATQELEVSPADFFTKEEWAEMTDEERYNTLEDYAAEMISDRYLDIGLVIKD